MNRAGLKKVKKVVRGKHGTTSRSYWVKSASVVKSGLVRHGAALGGFVGGHAGGFLGGRHAAPHIQKAARWAAQRMAQR